MRSPYPAYGGQPSDSNQYRYPPVNGPYGNLPSSSAVNLASPNKNPYLSSVQIRGGSRTPSPTPSEAAELARTSALDWDKLKNWRFWIRREWLWYYVAIVIISVVVALVTIFHTQIVHGLTPVATWIKDLPAGWLIPIAILFVISFPPLFGHEIIAVLCGVVWGLWIGFAIVAAGTFIGEVGNFYAFKWCCRARGEKLEKTNMTYGVLARVVRDGGFKIALIARLSAIPGHFTTAVFSSCGMGIIVFSIAAILSLPKQFVTVYLGVLIEDAGAETTGQRIASYAVVAVTIIITVAAMWYIYHQMGKAKPAYIYDRRKARQAKLAEANMSTATFSQSSVTLSAPGQHPTSSGSDIALGSFSPQDTSFQQWDASGRAVGHVGDPRLHAPAPRSANGHTPTFRTEGGGSYNTSGAHYEPEEEGTGVVYPTSPRADGRLPVRQNSWENGPAADTPTSPPLRNPFESRTAPVAYASAYPGAPSTRLAQSQSQPASRPLSASVSPYDAAYDYNPQPYSSHPYALADAPQTHWHAPASNGALMTQPATGGAVPSSAPAGAPAAGSVERVSSPRQRLSPPPAYGPAIAR